MRWLLAATMLCAQSQAFLRASLHLRHHHKSASRRLLCDNSNKWAPRTARHSALASSSSASSSVPPSPAPEAAAEEPGAGGAAAGEFGGIGCETLSVLFECDDFAVVAKPAGVPCHHSDWVGSSASKPRGGRRGRNRHKPRPAERDGPTPVLQRARETFGRRVWLPHRLDRCARARAAAGFRSRRAVGASRSRRAHDLRAPPYRCLAPLSTNTCENARAGHRRGSSSSRVVVGAGVGTVRARATRHRRGASGCLLIAFSPRATAGLQAALSASPRKEYYALCRGEVSDVASRVRIAHTSHQAR